MELKSSRAALLVTLFGRAVFAAALGSICGVAAMGTYSLAFEDPTPLVDFFTILGMILAGAFPVALLILLLIGGPLTYLLVTLADTRWSIGAGALIGAGLGLLLPELASTGPHPWMVDPFAVIGSLVGGFTGVFWAMLARGPIIRMEETSFDETP